MTQQVVIDPATGEQLPVPDNWVIFNTVSASISNNLAEYIAWSVAYQARLVGGQPSANLRTVVERLLLCGVRTELRLHGCTDIVIEKFTQAIANGTPIDWAWLEPSPPPTHPNSTAQLLLHERRRKQEKELADKRARAEVEAKLERMVFPVLRIFDELRDLNVLLKCHGHNGTLPAGHRPQDGGFVIPPGAELREERSRTVRCFLVGSNEGASHRRYLAIWPSHDKGTFSYIGTWGSADHSDRQVFTEANLDSLRHWVLAAVTAHEYSPPDVLDPAYRLPAQEKPGRVISIDETQ